MADWPKNAKWLTADEKQFLTAQYEDEVAAKNAVRHYTVWQALREREVVKLCVTYFLWITGFWGFCTGCHGVAGGVWLVESGRRLGDCRRHVFVVGVHALDQSSLGQDGRETLARRHRCVPCRRRHAAGHLDWSPAWAFFVICLTAIGVYAPFGVWWSYPTTFLSGAAAAGAIGLINSCGNVGGFIGPYLIGFLKDTTGSFTSGWLYLACLAGLCRCADSDLSAARADRRIEGGILLMSSQPPADEFEVGVDPLPGDKTGALVLDSVARFERGRRSIGLWLGPAAFVAPLVPPAGRVESRGTSPVGDRVAGRRLVGDRGDPDSSHRVARRGAGRCLRRHQCDRCVCPVREPDDLPVHRHVHHRPGGFDAPTRPPARILAPVAQDRPRQQRLHPHRHRSVVPDRVGVDE